MDDNQYRYGVLLTDTEREIVRREAIRRGLGWKRGFSPALRMIIREWAELSGYTPQPAQPKPEAQV